MHSDPRRDQSCPEETQRETARNLAGCRESVVIAGKWDWYEGCMHGTPVAATLRLAPKLGHCDAPPWCVLPPVVVVVCYDLISRVTLVKYIKYFIYFTYKDIINVCSDWYLVMMIHIIGLI